MGASESSESKQIKYNATKNGYGSESAFLALFTSIKSSDTIAIDKNLFDKYKVQWDSGKFRYYAFQTKGSCNSLWLSHRALCAQACNDNGEPLEGYPPFKVELIVTRVGRDDHTKDNSKNGVQRWRIQVSACGIWKPPKRTEVKLSRHKWSVATMIMKAVAFAKDFGGYHILKSNCIMLANGLKKRMVDDGPPTCVVRGNIDEWIKGKVEEAGFKVAWFSGKPIDHGKP